MPVPLHVHSWYSLLEGVNSPQVLLERAWAAGHASLALTDTNNLYGAVTFAETAQKMGLRPLLGACLRQQRSRCVALIGEPAGYRSLCRILSRLHLAEPPQTLPELLLENDAGLHLLVDDLVLADRVREVFAGRLWLEIVRPNRSLSAERELLAYGRRQGFPIVASTAAHFAGPEDYQAFRIGTAVSRRMLLDHLPAQLTITPAHHLPTTEQLAQRFRDLPEAVRNTDRLAEQLHAHVLPRQTILPRPRLPRQLDANAFLGLLCEQGLRRRDLGADLTARQRLRDELAIIAAGELAGYFLVVRDLARFARHRDYPMALRGSAGNSLVCYLLGITDVNPLRFRLPLERFLHPGRADLPDIDLDFDWKIRDEVIAYAFRRHGPKHTAMICTHQFLQPRSAFREGGKLHGLSNEQMSRLLETLDDRVEGLVTEDPLAGRSDAAPRQFPLEPERWPHILAAARALLGRPQHLSIHPGGIVITPKPIENYAPLERAPKGVIITQYEKDAAEYLGLVKIDLLGNRALGTVAAGGKCPEPAADDPAVIALLQQGDTLGVNQLESPALRHLLIQMQPQGVEDVIQALALIRPGAASIGSKECFVRRRRGLEPVRSLHPWLDGVLQETCGLMVFEDDALEVIRALTGLPAPEADRFRKRVAKHRTEAEARELTVEFLTACARQGVSRRVAGEVWVQLAKFNQYSFCKSHAVSYGLIAWRAVGLKAHRPLVFWTAALNNNQGMYPRRVYIEAIKRAGIALQLPCVNCSADEFTIEAGTIRVGLGAIAGLPEEFRTGLLAERNRRGPFRSLAEFRERLEPGPETLDLLIRCGALDFTGLARPMLFLEADLPEPPPSSAGRLFGDDPALDWSPPDYEQERRWRDEWGLLGFVVGPPMISLFRPLLPRDRVPSADLPRWHGKRVRVAGLVATARHTPTSDGRTMQFIALEDEVGLVDVTLFPGTCPLAPYLTIGPYVAEGRVEEQFGVYSLTAESFHRLEPAGAAGGGMH